MFEESILENNFDDEVLADDGIFDSEISDLENEDDEDGVEFESFDDPASDW
jgi:hypothetical protein